MDKRTGIEGRVSVSLRRHQRVDAHIQLNIVVHIFTRMAARLSEVFRTRTIMMMKGKAQKVTLGNLSVRLGRHPQRVS